MARIRLLASLHTRLKRPDEITSKYTRAQRGMLNKAAFAVYTDLADDGLKQEADKVMSCDIPELKPSQSPIVSEAERVIFEARINQKPKIPIIHYPLESYGLNLEVLENIKQRVRAGEFNEDLNPNK